MMEMDHPELEKAIRSLRFLHDCANDVSLSVSLPLSAKSHYSSEGPSYKCLNFHVSPN